MSKIVLAFDSFKGCMSSADACHAAAEGVRSAVPNAEVVEVPLSDGGEGLTACVERLLPTRTVRLQVHGPLMEKVEASYAVATDGLTAYMEMAAASGLTLVPEQRRNPLLTTTYGCGEMIADAVRRGCRRIVMGIGGSATCDGGSGMVEALTDNDCLQPDCQFVVASDVANPLYGSNGAAYIFAPQKGATPEQVEILDRRLRHFARATELAGLATPQLACYPGAGAAGGLGYAFLAYLKAELRSGIDIVLDLANFNHLIADADLVVTGEGRSDSQTLMGKVPYGVLRRCQQKALPVCLLSGAIDDASGVLARHFAVVRSINANDSRPLSVLMQPEVAKANMRNAARDLSYICGSNALRVLAK